MNDRGVATRFQKGVSGNPAGAPRLPSDIRIARRHNQANLIKLVMEQFAMTDEQILAKVKDEQTSQLERAVHGMIGRAREGETNAFKYLIELMCGHIPAQDVESVADSMTLEEKLELLRKAAVTVESQIKNGSRPAQ